MEVRRFLKMKEAGAYLCQSYRWMQRNYINLIRNGVIAFRIPKGSSKGHLVFEKNSLDQYVKSCQIREGQIYERKKDKNPNTSQPIC
jgi:hypothetical protein